MIETSMVRVFLRHLFKKLSNINGFMAITKQYSHLKIEKTQHIPRAFHENGMPFCYFRR